MQRAVVEPRERARQRRVDGVPQPSHDGRRPPPGRDARHERRARGVLSVVALSVAVARREGVVRRDGRVVIGVVRAQYRLRLFPLRRRRASLVLIRAVLYKRTSGWS